MVLFEQSQTRTRIGRMNRRDPSCYAQRTRLDVHRALARVSTVRQKTADDNDNDARGRDHETSVRGTSPVTVVLSEQATHARRLALQTPAPCQPKKTSKKSGINSDGVQVRPMRPDVHGPADDADFSGLTSIPIGATRRPARPCDCRPQTFRDPPTWGACDTKKVQPIRKSLRRDSIMLS